MLATCWHRESAGPVVSRVSTGARKITSPQTKPGFRCRIQEVVLRRDRQSRKSAKIKAKPNLMEPEKGALFEPRRSLGLAHSANSTAPARFSACACRYAAARSAALWRLSKMTYGICHAFMIGSVKTGHESQLLPC